MITLKVNGLEEIEKRFRESPKQMRKAFRDFYFQIGGIGQRTVKQIITRGGYGARKAIDTGAMRNNIGFVRDDNKAVISTSPRTDYAAAVHDGSRPHKIKNAFGRKGFTVNHPGTKPNPFMKASATKMTRNKVLEKTMSRIIEKYI